MYFGGGFVSRYRVSEQPVVALLGLWRPQHANRLAVVTPSGLSIWAVGRECRRVAGHQRQLGEDGETVAAALHPTEPTVVLVTDRGAVHLYRVDPDRLTHVGSNTLAPAGLRCVASSSAAVLLGSADGHLLSANWTGECLSYKLTEALVPALAETEQLAVAEAIELSPRTRQLFVALAVGVVALQFADSEAIRTLSPSSSFLIDGAAGARRLAHSPLHDHLAVGLADGRVLLYRTLDRPTVASALLDPRSCPELHGASGPVSALLWSPDARLVSGSWAPGSSSLAVGWADRGMAVFGIAGSCSFTSCAAEAEPRPTELAASGCTALLWPSLDFALWVAESGRPGGLAKQPLIQLQSSCDTIGRLAQMVALGSAMVHVLAVTPDKPPVWRHWGARSTSCDYLADNWPLRCAAVNPASGAIAVAGRHGAAILTGTRCRVFGNVLQEQAIACTAMAWCCGALVLCSQTASGSNELLFFPPQHLDNVSTLLVRSPVFPQVVSVALLASGIRFCSALCPESAGAADEPDSTCIAVQLDCAGQLSVCDMLDQSSDPVKLIFEADHFWLSAVPLTAQMDWGPPCWVLGPAGTTLCHPLASLRGKPALKGVVLPYQPSACTIGMCSTGSTAIVARHLGCSAALPFHAIHTTPKPMLAWLVHALVQRGLVQPALHLLREPSHAPVLQETLERALYFALEPHAVAQGREPLCVALPSGAQQVQAGVSSAYSQYEHSNLVNGPALAARSNGSTTLDVALRSSPFIAHSAPPESDDNPERTVKRTLDLLRTIGCSLAPLLVRCARKLDPAVHWQSLFKAVGNPLVSRCHQTLLCAQYFDGPKAAADATLLIVDGALQTGDLALVSQLGEFIRARDEPSHQGFQQAVARFGVRMLELWHLIAAGELFEQLAPLLCPLESMLQSREAQVLLLGNVDARAGLMAVLSQAGKGSRAQLMEQIFKALVHARCFVRAAVIHAALDRDASGVCELLAQVEIIKATAVVTQLCESASELGREWTVFAEQLTELWSEVQREASVDEAAAAIEAAWTTAERDFLAMDANGDGVLSKEEYIAGRVREAQAAAAAEAEAATEVEPGGDAEGACVIN